MKIQESNNTFQLFNGQKENVISTMQKKYTSLNLRQESVRVDISEEGLENYRKSVQKASEEHGGLEENYKEWLNVEKNPIKINPYTELMLQLDNVTKKKELRTTEDVADAVFKIYTSMYDELCKEYEEGTLRSWFKEGIEYRRGTKEEELAMLNDAYMKAAKTVQHYFEYWKPRMEKLKEDMWKSEALTVWEKEHRVLERPKRETDRSKLKIENIYTSMMHAGRLFRQGYSVNENQKEFLERISNISRDFYNPAD